MSAVGDQLDLAYALFQQVGETFDSIPMIDRTYGHLARDSEEAIRSRLEARGAADALRDTSE